MSDDIETQKTPRWTPFILALAVTVFIGSTAWNVGTRITSQSKTTSSIEQVVDAIETTCFENAALARQYRIRGEDEIILTRSVLLTTKTLIVAIKGSPPSHLTLHERQIRSALVRHYEATLPKLRHILATIHILPPPDCQKQAERLRAKLPPG